MNHLKDDGDYFIERNPNFLETNFSLVKRKLSYGPFVLRHKYVAGIQFRNNFYEVELYGPYNPETDSDCEILERFEDKEEAIKYLWNCRLMMCTWD